MQIERHGQIVRGRGPNFGCAQEGVAERYPAWSEAGSTHPQDSCRTPNKTFVQHSFRTGKFTGKILDQLSFALKRTESVTWISELQLNSLLGQNREFFAESRDYFDAEQGTSRSNASPPQHFPRAVFLFLLARPQAAV
jgi:hypothetical protein